MKAIPLLACLAIALAPLAAAGTQSSPEIQDPSGDGGVDQLDLLGIWIDSGDTSNVAFHATLSGAPPTPTTTEGTTVGSSTCVQSTGCAYTSFTYTFSFRVTTPSGANAPAFSDYNVTTVTFRDGPANPSLVAPIGYLDGRGVPTYDGTQATVSVNGKEIMVLVPRSSLFVGIPAGATPGAYTIGHLRVTSQPETCFPPETIQGAGTVNCAPLARPMPSPSNLPPTTSLYWDIAPNTGFGMFTYPSAGSATSGPATVTTTRTVTATQTVTQTQTVNQNGQPLTTTQTVTHTAPGTTSTETVTVSATAAINPAGASKKSPAPEIVLVVAGLAGLLALVRRRLSA